MRYAYGISSTPHCAAFTGMVGELSDRRGSRRVGSGCLACCGGSWLEGSPSEAAQAVAHPLSLGSYCEWCICWTWGTKEREASPCVCLGLTLFPEVSATGCCQAECGSRQTLNLTDEFLIFWVSMMLNCIILSHFC